MEQYINLLSAIKEKSTYKPAARANMPGTQSLFGYQFRHDLSKGFPLLTTKKIKFKNIVTELLWFLRGDINIKYLNDNGFYLWNEDAYNYYCKPNIGGNNSKDGNAILKFVPPNDQNAENTFESVFPNGLYTMLKFDEFVNIIQNTPKEQLPKFGNYTLGDCGYQYGKVWRNWETTVIDDSYERGYTVKTTDQIKVLIDGLKKSPQGRRHIVTAIDPAHDTDLALYWCHSIFQFNCRPLTIDEKRSWIYDHNEDYDTTTCPQYYLDCQLYQRSADVFLGVPYNIASYALLTHVLASMCNMIPGEYIHTFGDVHIYDNHKDAIETQLPRDCKKLPKLVNTISSETWDLINTGNYDFSTLNPRDFIVEEYDPHPFIKADLSTGLIK
jgi:thymidylate synthase